MEANRVPRRQFHPHSHCIGSNTDLNSLADEWAQTAVFYNICGPTEITILNTAHKHSPGTPLSIGRPLPNTTLYVLDENMEPVPVGSKGVMWVGGAGVSRGYINLPELSATRYKIDKFANDGYVDDSSFDESNLILAAR